MCFVKKYFSLIPKLITAIAIDDYEGKNIILPGDLNTYINVKIDKPGGKKENQTKFSENLKSMLDSLGLDRYLENKDP